MRSRTFSIAVGLTNEYFETNQAGTFALEGHVRYFNEVRVGQHVTIRTRVIGRSDKRFHILHFMTNDDTGKLAATMEAIGTHVDLRIRRSAPVSPPSGGRLRSLAGRAFPAALAGSALRGDARLKADEREASRIGRTVSRRP